MPIDPMMGFTTPTTAAPSFWDRLQSGLLGPSQSYGGLLSPEDQAAARRQAMMSFGTQMMQAGGYSQTPVSFGQALASGIQAGQQGQKSNIDERLQAMLVATQLQKKPRKPVAVIGADGKPTYVSEDNAIGQTPMTGAGGKESPLLQAYDVAKTQGYTKSLLEFQKELSNAQANYPYTVAVVNGVATLVDRTTGQPIGGMGGQTAPSPAGQPPMGAPPDQSAPPQMAPRTIPLTTLPQEGAAQNELARQKGEGGALGEAQGKIAGGIQTKGSNADTVNSMLDEAVGLVPQATGSTAGAGVDATAGFFGHATSGAKAIARLKVLQAGLILNQPRLEGPQSDRDQMLYREMAGQIGDPSVPDDIKLAAIGTIRSIQNKYAQRASGAGAPSAVGVPKPGATRSPSAGTVEGGYRFKGGDPSKPESWEKVK